MTRNRNIFVLVENLLDSVTEIQLWLSLNTLLKNSVFGRWISKTKYTYIINSVKGVTLHIIWFNAIYSASVVLKDISVCNLLNHNTGNPAYVITYPVHGMVFYALSESAWSRPPENSTPT